MLSLNQSGPDHLQALLQATAAAHAALLVQLPVGIHCITSCECPSKVTCAARQQYYNCLAGQEQLMCVLRRQA